MTSSVAGGAAKVDSRVLSADSALSVVTQLFSTSSVGRGYPPSIREIGDAAWSDVDTPRRTSCAPWSARLIYADPNRPRAVNARKRPTTFALPPVTEVAGLDAYRTHSCPCLLDVSRPAARLCREAEDVSLCRQ